MPDSEFRVIQQDEEMEWCESPSSLSSATPIFSPHSPDYLPNQQPPPINCNQRIYGEKINALERLVCRPVGERNILIEQLTFRSLTNDQNSQNDDDAFEDANPTATESCGGGVGGGGGNGGVSFDTESVNDGSVGVGVRIAASSIASGDECFNPVVAISSSSECGGSGGSDGYTNAIINDYENKTNSIIIIPSPTARVYSSFAINRHSIPKLCCVCFRSYCVCAKESIDHVTRRHHDPRNYEFFRNKDDDDSQRNQ